MTAERALVAGFAIGMVAGAAGIVLAALWRRGAR